MCTQCYKEYTKYVEVMRMAVMNLRGVPDEIHRQAKIRAAVEGVTLKDFVLRVLTEYLEQVEKKEKKT
jgi:plasmid stability protein